MGVFKKWLLCSLFVDIRPRKIIPGLTIRIQLEKPQTQMPLRSLYVAGYRTSTYI